MNIFPSVTTTTFEQAKAGRLVIGEMRGRACLFIKASSGNGKSLAVCLTEVDGKKAPFHLYMDPSTRVLEVVSEFRFRLPTDTAKFTAYDSREAVGDVLFFGVGTCLVVGSVSSQQHDPRYLDLNTGELGPAGGTPALVAREWQIEVQASPGVFVALKP